LQIQAHDAVRVAIDVEYGSDVDLAVVPVITPQQLRHRRVGDPGEQRLPGDPDLYPLLDLHIGHPELVGWDASWPGEPGRCTPLVHKNIGSDRSILRMSGGAGPEPGGESGGDSSTARASLAGLSPSHLREWLPGVFAARLLRGVQLPNGRVVGETDRVVHLFPIPSGRMMPERLRAFCGLVIRPGQAELVTVGTGMPCVACVVAAPDPEPT